MSGVFETSRWTPVVMDIMEAVVHDRNLDTNHYPFFPTDTQVTKPMLTPVLLPFEGNDGGFGITLSFDGCEA